MKYKKEIEFIKNAKTKKEVYDYLRFDCGYEKEFIIKEIIDNYDEQLLSKIDSKLISERNCIRIALKYGDDGLKYFPSKKNALADRFRGKRLELLQDGISFNEGKFIIDYALYINEKKWSRIYSYRTIAKSLKEVYELVGNLNGIELYEMPKKNYKGLNYEGMYVLREFSNKFPGAKLIDYGIISKRYNTDTKDNGYFAVDYGWYSDDRILKKDNSKTKIFDSFKKFSKYLKNDLSGADLGDYDLSKHDITKYNLTNATYLTKEQKNSQALIKTIKRNELKLIKKKDFVPVIAHEEIYEDDYAYYISDIHFDSKIIEKCKTDSDIKIFIDNKIKELQESLPEGMMFNYSRPLIVLGDTSSEYIINKYFYKELNRRFKNIIVILGNHELWFDNYKKQIEKYCNLFKDLDIQLIHNGLYVMNEYLLLDKECRYYSFEELKRMTIKQLKEIGDNNRLLIFGGIGYSGLNNEFNANHGIYRDALTRIEEIKESAEFEKLYLKIRKALSYRQVVVATHMPKDCWSKTENCSNWIYLHGHNHRNEFVNDDINHIYADNQIGYPDTTFTLAHFNYNNTYDTFRSYKNGIYEITSFQYKNFCKGKNIQMSYKNQDKVIMIKKNDYYLFMRKNKKNYVLLNGGKPLKVKNDPKYYYKHMDEQVDLIMRPLSEYTAYQETISKYVKSFGGNGKIHGCIIDIDFYNHLYVNPKDLKVTPYYATDIINKTVYSSIEYLLKQRRPDLLLKYSKKTSNKNLPVVYGNKKNLTTLYTSTNIYSPSRIIRAMQYLKDVKVLRCWYEVDKETTKAIIKNQMNYIR